MFYNLGKSKELLFDKKSPMAIKNFENWVKRNKIVQNSQEEK